jgi:hypothetical protein
VEGREGRERNGKKEGLTAQTRRINVPVKIMREWDDP